MNDIQGTPPTFIEGPSDGVYWIKIANARYVYVAATPDDWPSQNYFTWDAPETHWEIVRVGDMIDWLGSDEGYDPFVDGALARAIELGPRIEEPEP